MNEVKINDYILIKNMKDELNFKPMIGRVPHIDAIGQIHGTWSGLAIIPEVGGIRKETKSYPNKSLREAILNAICHTDYSMPSNIKIEFYDDRVEITNPGSIYRYNVDDILMGIQSFRNPKLIDILHKLGFIENYGTGLKRIKDGYSNYDIKDFLFDSRQWFRVVLPNLNYNITDIKDNVPNNVPNNVPKNNEELIIDLIKENPNITRNELAATLKLSEKTITRTIAASNKIRRVGPKNGGHWEIIEN